MLQSLATSSCGRILEQRRSACVFLGLLLAYAVYLVVGAAVFSALERPAEQDLRDDLRSLRTKFLADHPCVRDAELEVFLEKIMGASNYGVSVLNNASGRVNWDFTSALFFASTVLTTTGYGHSVPLSDGGKAFCIIYSVVGIPFTLLLLTAVVQRLMAVVTRRPIAYMQRRLGASRQRVATAHAVALAVVVITCFFFIPAGIFTALETSWNFLEAFYFCFISLSTIGLGDYVPGEAYGQHLRELYKFCVTCYLIIGLVAMLLMLDTLGELSEIRYLSGIFHTGGPGGTGGDDDDDRIGIVDSEELPVSTVSDLAANGGGGGEKSSQPLAFSGPASTYHTMGNGQ